MVVSKLDPKRYITYSFKAFYYQLLPNIFMHMDEQGFCFGFVEFEVASAAQSALEVFIRYTWI